MPRLLPALALLTACGPFTIPHPLPTAPLTAAQPTEPGDRRLSGLHSRVLIDSEVFPNILSGHTVGRLDLGREWGDIGLSLGKLNTESTPGATTGIQVGRTLISGEPGAFGVTGGLGGTLVAQGSGDLTYYSSLAPSLGVRGHRVLAERVRLGGTASVSHSWAWSWDSGYDYRLLWVEGSGGLILGRPDRLQASLGVQYLGTQSDVWRQFFAPQVALSLSL